MLEETREPTANRRQRWWNWLNQSELEILRMIQDFMDRRETFGDRGASFLQLCQKVASCLGDRIGRMLHDAWKPSNFPQERVLFWPAYHIFAQDQPGRVDRRSAQSFRDLDTENIHLLQRINAYRYPVPSDGNMPLFPLVVWMQMLYEEFLDGLRLMGFTKWFALNGNLQILNPSRREKASLLALEIRIHSTNGASVRSEDGLLRIQLSESERDPVAFLKRFQEYLQVSDRFLLRHNRELLKTDFPIVEYTRGELSPRQVEAAHAAFAVLFYSIFCKEDIDDIHFKAILRDLEQAELAGLYERVCKGGEFLRAFGGERESYSHYYVIPLDRVLSIEAAYSIRPDLGTINLYTSREIPAALLRILKKTLQVVYERLRLVEAIVSEDKLGKLHQSTISHEMEKVVPCITGKNSDFLLDLIKGYFLVLVLTPRMLVQRFKADSWDFPPGFADGKDFREFIENTFMLAEQINYLVQSVRVGRIGLEEASFKKMALDSLKLLHIPKNETFARALTRHPYLPLFAAALVCAFRNILEHRPEHSIRVSFRKGVLQLETDFSGNLERKSEMKRGSTHDSLAFYARSYEGDPLAVELLPGESTFLTRVPVPPSLLID